MPKRYSAKLKFQVVIEKLIMNLSLVLPAAASMWCAERAIEIMGSVLDLPLPTPTWFAGRLWLMRLGYYRLTRPKVQADD